MPFLQKSVETERTGGGPTKAFLERCHMRHVVTWPFSEWNVAAAVLSVVTVFLLVAFSHRPPGFTQTKVIFSLSSPDFIMHFRHLIHLVNDGPAREGNLSRLYAPPSYGLSCTLVLVQPTCSSVAANTLPICSHRSWSRSTLSPAVRRRLQSGSSASRTSAWIVPWDTD